MNPSKQTPYTPKVSIVVCGRNDGYGGNEPKRTIMSVNSMLETSVDEVIYVDWCSPDRKSIWKEHHKFLVNKDKFVEIRVTEDDLYALGVDDDIMDQFSGKLPIIDVWARNIGIRRAQGDIIISSNPDILVTEGMVAATRNAHYQYAVAPRRDVHENTFNQFDFLEHRELVEFLVEHVSGYPCKPRATGEKWSGVVCCGDWQAAPRQLWYDVKGFEEGMIFRSFADTNLFKKMYNETAGCKPTERCTLLGLLPEDSAIFHLNHIGHGGSSGGVQQLNDYDKWVTNFVETKNTNDWGWRAYPFQIVTYTYTK